MRDAVGIDVSKDMLDAFRLSGKEHRRFSTTRPGVRSLMDWLEGGAAQIVVFEATGVYHRLLETVLAAGGMTYAQVNPRQARRFAEGTGALAKTDRGDASMLAEMGAVLELESGEPRSAKLHDLREMLTAKRAHQRPHRRQRTACGCKPSSSQAPDIATTTPDRQGHGSNRHGA